MKESHVIENQATKQPKMLIFVLVYLFNLFITPVILLYVGYFIGGQQNPALLTNATIISQFITLIYGLITFRSFLLAEAKKLRFLDLSIALVCGFVLRIILSIILMKIFPIVQSDNQATLEAMFKVANPAVMFLLVVVSAPIVEELVFRQAIIGNLSNKVNVHLLTLVSAVLFIFAHTGTDISSATMYVGITVPIIVLYRYFNNNVVAAIAMHALSNLVAFGVMFLLL